MAPFFSILTPTCDRPFMLGRTLRSVLDQGFPDFEVIVYDNGTERVTADEVPELGDPRVRLIEASSGGPCGPVAAFNGALRFAVGSVLHPLADDDRLAPGALSAAVEALEGVEWLVGLTQIVDQAGGLTNKVIGTAPDPERLRFRFDLGGAVYWRRSLTDRLGGFDPEFEGAADWDLYRRFANDGAAYHFISEILYLYTEHPATDTNANRSRQDDAVRRLREAAAA